MKISPDVLYGLLSEKFQLSRLGMGIRTKELSLPAFFEPGNQTVAGGVYVARTGDLPNIPPENCVIICCGTKPSKMWNKQSCDVMHIVDHHTNIVGIFNTVLGIFNRILTWEDTMQQLALSGASVKEMMEISIPIFENTMTVTDFELKNLAFCEQDRSLPGMPIKMSDRYPHVPPAYISATKNFGQALRNNREPYMVEEIENIDEGIEGVSSYCINLFYGDVYAGTCSLKEEAHPLRSYDRELFQIFAAYIHECLGVQSRSTGNQLVSVRAVFEQLLQGYPVSRRDMSSAINLIEFNSQDMPVEECRWCCSVIQNPHHDRGLPETYLRETIETAMPNTTAFLFDGAIVAFSLISDAEQLVDKLCVQLEEYLDDMDFYAGVSRAFRDPFRARTFYRQALVALELGGERSPGRRCRLFDDHALDFMLHNCSGDFETEAIVSPELVRLWHSGQSGPEYVKTLKAYLDKGCHVTQTANALFLHRSTLIKRLDRIREIVDLSSDSKRLYLQMCLHLPDVEQILEADSDLRSAD